MSDSPPYDCMPMSQQSCPWINGKLESQLLINPNSETFSSFLTLGSQSQITSAYQAMKVYILIKSSKIQFNIFGVRGLAFVPSGLSGRPGHVKVDALSAR